MKKRLIIIVSAVIVAAFIFALGFTKTKGFNKADGTGKDSSKVQKIYIGSSDEMLEDEKDEYPPTTKEKPLAIFDKITDGYTDKQSYNPGDTVRVYINATGIFNNKTVYLYNIRMVKKDSVNANLFPQTMSAIQPWLNYGYVTTFSYVIPSGFRSGMYHFGNKIFFIVKNPLKNADITIVYPSNTEAAYNDAGGKSLYDFNSGGNRATRVTFQRPLGNFILDEIQFHSRPFMKWLQNIHSYSIQYIADSDMDDYNEISNSKLLVVVGHSEYWSRRARANFDQFVDVGHDAAVLSGNTMWWQVRYNNDKTQLVCYKDSAADPEANSLLKTIEWPRASLYYSTLKSIGCDFPHGAYGMHAYHGNYGYTIMLPNSPLLQGTGLGFHSFLSCQSYEYDATLFSGFSSIGEPIVDSVTLGFCKIEMIGYDYGNATSAFNSPKGWGTFIVFRKAPTSGVIINTGFNTFTGKTNLYGSGGITGPDSNKVQKIVMNIFNKLLTHQNVFANPNSCTNNTTGIASNNPGLNNLLVYPNPSKGVFKIQADLSAFKNVEFDCYDLSGKKVFSKKLNSSESNDIDLSQLGDGSYLYAISSDHEKIISHNRLVIIH